MNPYGETFHTELNRLYDAQNTAAQQFTSQTLYLREKLYANNDALRAKRAEEAAQEWLRPRRRNQRPQCL